MASSIIRNERPTQPPPAARDPYAELRDAAWALLEQSSPCPEGHRLQRALDSAALRATPAEIDETAGEIMDHPDRNVGRAHMRAGRSAVAAAELDSGTAEARRANVLRRRELLDEEARALLDAVREAERFELRTYSTAERLLIAARIAERAA